MAIITLKSGIILDDNRNLSLGINIKNQKNKYFTLCYSSKDGFYLNVGGLWLNENNLDEYIKYQSDAIADLKEAISLI